MYLSLIPSLILNLGTSVTTMSSSYHAPTARSGAEGDREEAVIDADEGATKATAGVRRDDARRRADFMSGDCSRFWSWRDQ